LQIEAVSMSRVQQATKRVMKRVVFRTRDEAFAALQKAVREESRREQTLDREVQPRIRTKPE
jgi:hypothetical protein